MHRITRRELYMESAKLAAKRSQCTKKHVGCVLVKDRRISAIGYNGVLPGLNPLAGLDEQGNTHTVHAEANVIAYCAKHGIATDNCEMYITLSPCEKCAELIIQAGIKSVTFLEKYRDETGILLLQKQGISVIQYEEPIQNM